MVLQAQQWVNRTYEGVSGYNSCTENGHTGWETMFSLTRALQHELGITALSDNFGPTTLARLTSYGPVGPTSSNLNVRTIVEAALYCKGYYGGDIDGAFGSLTQSGLASMLQNMGLASTVNVTPKVFKALLTMDAYVLLDGGSAGIRACQQWLNSAYYSRGGFFIGPCDGYFSRGVQSALVLAIQYQLGMSDDTVTGAIGPNTENGLRTQGYVAQGSGPAAWIRLLQCAVQFNDKDCDWVHPGTFTAALAGQVRAFQSFCALPQSGAGDYQTWMSLLVSTGDPDRVGTAFDCMYPLNSTTIQTVKAAGYRTVGRYLTGGTNKALTSSEITLILDNGLSFFPIYQESGDAVEDFDYDQGHAAGGAANTAARTLGVPEGTVLYVAVDFDATDDDITASVIPHFQGVRNAMADAGSYYRIGVYGCRNTCSRLSAEGLAMLSFVSGMSTGYSGNLGFALPANWAFDQIANRTLGAGTAGSVEIDNDMVSGRDTGVASVTRNPLPNDGFFTLLRWLEARADQWREQGNLARSGPQLVAGYLQTRNGRFETYPQSGIVFGSVDNAFNAFVGTSRGRPDDSGLHDPKYQATSDLDHFGASFDAVVTHGLAGDRGSVNLADFGSWAGDLLTVLGDFAGQNLPDSQAYTWAATAIANKSSQASEFSLSDWIADIDAMTLGLDSLNDPSVPLSERLMAAYASPTTAVGRFASFSAQRFGGTNATALSAARALFGNTGNTLTEGVRDAFWIRYYGSYDIYARPSDLPQAVTDAVAQAFVDAVARFASGA